MEDARETNLKTIERLTQKQEAVQAQIDFGRVYLADDPEVQSKLDELQKVLDQSRIDLEFGKIWLDNIVPE